jgi:endonuclease/exonuclease/phosphatase family metal-dependent hydrolase
VVAALRIVTINFWGNQPPFDRRVELGFRQLARLGPDVIAMQEVQAPPGGNRTSADLIAEGLGMHCIYGMSLQWDAGDWGPGTPAGEEGLAILSRHPVVEQRLTRLPQERPLEKRILLSAHIQTPAGPVWVHTTHLHYRLEDGVAREAQVFACDEVLRELASETPQILCGDFNAPPDSDEIRFLRGLHSLGGRRTHYQDAWQRAHPGDAGITWSSENELTRPLRSLDIDRRIDYVFVTSRRRDGRGTVHRAEVVLDERDDTGICASDHYGVLAEVQIAPGHEP